MDMIIAIDFDGVICKRSGIPRNHDFSKDFPVGGAKEAIEWLISVGHEPYVLTARTPEEWMDILNWMVKHKFPPIEVTNVKKLGTKVIIDDRAYRFTNWLDISKYFG